MGIFKSEKAPNVTEGYAHDAPITMQRPIATGATPAIQRRFDRITFIKEEFE